MIRYFMEKSHLLKYLVFLNMAVAVYIAQTYSIHTTMIVLAIILFGLQNSDGIRKKLSIRPGSGESTFPYFYYYGVILLFVLSINYVAVELLDAFNDLVNSILVGIIFLTLGYDWILKIEDYKFKFIHLTIRRHETIEQELYFHFTTKTMVLPMLIGGIYLFLFNVFDILILYIKMETIDTQ